MLANVAGEVAVAVQPSGTSRVTEAPGRAVGPVLVYVVVAVTPVPGCTIRADEATARVWWTRITAEPVTPFTVTLIVAAPLPTAVTSPLRLTVATEGSLLR